MNKKILLSLFLIFCALPLFSKELEGLDLTAVNLILETNLQTNNLENLDDQLAVIESTKNQITEFGDELSEEAKIICFTSLEIQKLNLKNADTRKKEKELKKKPKKEKDPETEAFVMTLYDNYKTFAESHWDLSSHFYFHMKEAEFETLPFLSTGAQLKMFQNIADDYKKIEELNPNYGENLYFYGAILYMMPKIAGGDKEAGLEKIARATQVSTTKYEKVSSLTLYSQILFEDKKKDEAEKYLKMALEITPDSKTILEIQEMNKAGFSMFQSDKYEKKKNK